MIYISKGYGDSYMRADVPTFPTVGANTGEANSCSIQYYQPFLATNRTIMKFMMPPSGKTIQKISIWTYITSATVTAQPVNCHIMNDTNWQEMSVCWTNRQTGSSTTAWTAPGGDFTLATVNASFTDTTLSATGWFEWVVYGSGASAVNNITLPAYNTEIGFLFKAINGAEPTPTAGTTCTVGMYSSQYEYPSLRPYMAITVADDPHIPLLNLNQEVLRPAVFKNGNAR